MKNIEQQTFGLPEEITQHFEVLKTLKSEYQEAEIEENLLKKRDTPLEEYQKSFEIQFDKFITSLVDTLKTQTQEERQTTIISLITYINSNEENDFLCSEGSKSPDAFLHGILRTVDHMSPASSVKTSDVAAIKSDLNSRAKFAATPEA